MTLAAGVPIELPAGARALFTDRSHGNLSSVGGESHEQGLGARERLREACGVQALARVYQVHGRTVARLAPDSARVPADRAEQPQLRADGCALAVPAVGAIVLAADCLPVVLAAEGAVAAIHAGWRGLAAGVLEEGVRALREVGGDGGDGEGDGAILAIVGPCAGACCYEVGEEVHAALGGAPASAPTRSPSGVGRAPIDLRAIAHRRLLAAGVAAVSDVLACTICDERFFSYRREGARAGRQAAVAWLS